MCEHCVALLEALQIANRRIEELEKERDFAATLVKSVPKRIADINLLRQQGMSYDAIGRLYGISKQRVHQLIKSTNIKEVQNGQEDSQ